MVSHWPCRNWCGHCVRGRAKANPHRAVEREPELPIVGIDYMWMTSEEDDKKGKTAIGECRYWCRPIRNQGGWELGLYRKRGNFLHVVKVLVGNLESLGYTKVIVRSDQAPAIVKLSAVARGMTQELTCEESPVAESQSLGSVNIQVQLVQAQRRTLLDAVETRYGKRIDEYSVAAPWMVQRAVRILKQFRMGIDGRTAYQRVAGRDVQKYTVELGNACGT